MISDVLRAESTQMAEQVADPLEHPPTMNINGARLRQLRPTDADALYAYLRDPLVTDLTSYPVASLDFAEAIIERSLSR